MIIDQPINTPAAWSQRARAFADPWAACGWSRGGQMARFAEVVRAVCPLPGERVLDVGCGTGAFSDWLPDDVGYVGFDTAPAMVARAAREHPGRVFQTWEPTQRFDVTVAIGTFNLPGSKEETFAAVRRLWDKTARALAVSLYAGTDPRCLHYTLKDVDVLLGESFYAAARRWRRNDILVVLSRVQP